MQKLLTFSVASYNIEKYIDKLMHSVLKPEVLDKIEVLVVNDGSKDKTAKIAKEYEEKYPDTVRLIDKPNGGHGSTINRGILEATGKYFRALDGDDWVDSEALIKLVAKLPDIESDIILMDFKYCYEIGKTELASVTALEDGATYIFDDISDKIDYMLYHSVVYRTEFLRQHNIKLQEHCFYVDTEFMLYPIPYVNTLTYLALPLYCYRIGIGEQSVSIDSRKKHVNDFEKVAHNLLSFYKSLPDNISENKRSYISTGVANHCIHYIGSLLLFKPNIKHKNKIKDFDGEVLGVSKSIFDKMFEGAKTVKMLRASNYLMYRPMHIYKIFHES